MAFVILAAHTVYLCGRDLLEVAFLAKKHNSDCLKQNLGIAEKIDVFDILHVIVAAFYTAQMSVAPNLRSSAHTGLDGKLLHFPRLVVLEINGHKRTRTYEAHIPFKHIDELQKLVYLELAYCLADASEIFVGILDDGMIIIELHGCSFHRAEFVKHKGLAVFADSLLPEDCGTFAVKLDCESDDKQWQEKDNQSQKRKKPIHYRLKNLIHPASPDAKHQLRVQTA